MSNCALPAEKIAEIHACLVADKLLWTEYRSAEKLVNKVNFIYLISKEVPKTRWLSERLWLWQRNRSAFAAVHGRAFPAPAFFAK